MPLMDDWFNYGVILLVIAAASYVQAVAGFAFALIVMGVVPSLNLMNVADAAVIVTLLAMVNTATGLSKGFANVRWRQAMTSLLFSLPSIALGLYLLELMSGDYLDTLRLVLGVTILISGFMLLKPPHQDAKVSKGPSFAFFGFLSGLISGLFSTGGPPVVFQFYRQPWPMAVIRDSLFMLFFIGSFARTAMVALDTGIDTHLWVLSAIAFPVVVVFTKIGQRYAPGFSDLAIRRAVFGLLSVSALALMMG